LDTSADSTNVNTVKSAYGKAIQEEVVRFYNLNNPEDNALEPLLFYHVYCFEIYPFLRGFSIRSERISNRAENKVA
jgi:hypothetical protein